jgi:hypothetical protein
MRINEALNLVIPIYGDDDAIASYVHSMPLSRSAFEANYLLVSATFAAIYSEGLGETAGPKVAELILKDVARGRKIDAAPLLNEIRRLSCFIRPGAGGWENIPFQQAVDGRMISEEDAAEVMGALVFFTANSVMLPRKVLRPTLDGAARLWGAQITSLQPTGWIDGLRTSTATDSSGEMPPAAPASAPISTSSVLV